MACALAVLQHDQHGTGEGTASIDWDPMPMMSSGGVCIGGAFGYGHRL